MLRPIIHFLDKYIDLVFVRKKYFLIKYIITKLKYFFFKSKIQKWEKKIILKSFPFSMAGEEALNNCIKEIQYIERQNIPGDICEFGVAKGGTSLAMIMAHIYIKKKINRKFFLFDSFSGLPRPDKSLDFDKKGYIGKALFPLKEGSLQSNYIETKRLFYNQFNFSKNKVTFIKGFFEKTAIKNYSKINSISILRLDGDWFNSVYIPLKTYFNKISSGGVVIIDDYRTCIGAKRATDFFLKEKNIIVNKKYYGKGGMYFIKNIK